MCDPIPSQETAEKTEHELRMAEARKLPLEADQIEYELEYKRKTPVATTLLAPFTAFLTVTVAFISVTV